MSKSKKGILERLREGPVIGDGGYVFALEKRGYVKAGPWTPEAVIEFPDAVRQLHMDFLRAGADVIQAFTFYASGDKLESSTGVSYKSEDVNSAACDLAMNVTATSDAIVCGGISPTPTYLHKTGGKEAVQAEFQKQLDAFQRYEIDFVLAEFFSHIEEMEWAIEILKKSGKPVAATMRIGPTKDMMGVSPGDCAVRMAKAGADIIGVNCLFDYTTCLKTMKLMKDALAAADLHPFLMTQPLGYHVPEVENEEHGYLKLPEAPLGAEIVGINCIFDYRTCLKVMKQMKEALNANNLHPFLMMQPLGFHCPEVENCPQGYANLPEFPFALEPRLYTRWDVRKYAREAYEMGVRYIGGCCGFEPYHVREIAEELAEERGKRPPGADKNGLWGSGNKNSMFTFLRERSTKEYWANLKPSFGRPDCPILGKPGQDIL